MQQKVTKTWSKDTCRVGSKQTY